MPAETSEPRGRLLRFFSNPTIGIAGSVASIVGLLLAVYFYAADIKTRSLRYFVHPAKAVVVKAGQTSRLQITVDGLPVEKDVIAAQVAFWNEGAEPIRPQHMLRPLLIRTSGKNRILEARLRKVSRDVSNVALDVSGLNEGEVRVNWTILERYDGGIVQLIYFGDSDTSLSASSIVEGQGDIRAVAYSGRPETYDREAYVRDRFMKTFGYFYLGFGIFLTLYGASRTRKRPATGFFLLESLRWSFLLMGPIAIATALVAIFGLAARLGPPFGFD